MTWDRWVMLPMVPTILTAAGWGEAGVATRSLRHLLGILVRPAQEAVGRVPVLVTSWLRMRSVRGFGLQPGQWHLASATLAGASVVLAVALATAVVLAARSSRMAPRTTNRAPHMPHMPQLDRTACGPGWRKSLRRAAGRVIRPSDHGGSTHGTPDRRDGST